MFSISRINDGYSIEDNSTNEIIYCSNSSELLELLCKTGIEISNIDEIEFFIEDLSDFLSLKDSTIRTILNKSGLSKLSARKSGKIVYTWGSIKNFCELKYSIRDLYSLEEISRYYNKSYSYLYDLKSTNNISPVVVDVYAKNKNYYRLEQFECYMSELLKYKYSKGDLRDLGLCSNVLKSDEINSLRWNNDLLHEDDYNYIKSLYPYGCNSMVVKAEVFGDKCLVYLYLGAPLRYRKSNIGNTLFYKSSDLYKIWIDLDDFDKVVDLGNFELKDNGILNCIKTKHPLSMDILDLYNNEFVIMKNNVDYDYTKDNLCVGDRSICKSRKLRRYYTYSNYGASSYWTISLVNIDLDKKLFNNEFDAICYLSSLNLRYNILSDLSDNKDIIDRLYKNEITSDEILSIQLEKYGYNPWYYYRFNFKNYSIEEPLKGVVWDLDENGQMIYIINDKLGRYKSGDVCCPVPVNI